MEWKVTWKMTLMNLWMIQTQSFYLKGRIRRMMPLAMTNLKNILVLAANFHVKKTEIMSWSKSKTWRTAKNKGSREREKRKLRGLKFPWIGRKRAHHTQRENVIFVPMWLILSLTIIHLFDVFSVVTNQLKLLFNQRTL